MDAETFLPVGMCKNSLGPWALECGPSTPVTTNCVLGNFLPSIAMKGIEPPSPMKAGGLPKCALLALSSALASQGESAGAFQPVSPRGASNATVAPSGGLSSSDFFTAMRAGSASQVGGKRSDNFNVVKGRRT